MYYTRQKEQPIRGHGMSESPILEHKHEGNNSSNTVTAGNCSASHEEIIQAKFEKEALEFNNTVTQRT